MVTQNGEESTTEDEKEKEINIAKNVPMRDDQKPLISPTDRRGSQGTRSILLTGQMRHVKDINAIIFLCSPL